MLNPPAAHPESDQLLAFGLGKLDPVDAEEIANHLDRCRECSDTIVGLKDDTFVGLVRQMPGPADLSAGSDDSPPPAEPPDPFQATVNVAPGATETESKVVELPRELREHPRYEIAEVIGHGGMGEVYQAQHKLMNRPVALKVIKPELVRNEAAVRRFHREVQAAARLHHPNIVAAYDAEQAGNLHFLVMEFVDGVDLNEIVRSRGALPVDLACDYIRQAATGLQHAHSLGMVHRDIKPHNLMVTAAGEVKILDFGLANFVSELPVDETLATSEDSASDGAPPHHALEQLTQMGTMMGTPDYIAPEQARDAHAADIRADIYSLGCTFYTLLAGRAPFSEGTVLAKIRAHTEQVPKRLAEFRDDVPEEVEAIVLKMMAKNPEDRHQTPGAVAEALANRMSPVATAASGAVRARVRRRAIVATGVMFVCALLAAVFYIQTDKGVVRVEVADESLQVTISGQTISMKDGDTPLIIRAGEPKLIVRRGDFVFETESIQLRRGDKIALKVDLLAGEIVVQKDGERFGAKALPGPLRQPHEAVWPSEVLTSPQLEYQFQRTSQPLVIGMNDEFGMLFQGRLVAPAELSRRLEKALEENADRVVVIDLPKNAWTVAQHVDQLELIARITGAKQITRPAWSEIRLVFGVEKSGRQTLDIKGPAYTASGYLQGLLPNVREAIEKNPGLPVLLDVADGFNRTDPKHAEAYNDVRRIVEEAGATVRFDLDVSESNTAPEQLRNLFLKADGNALDVDAKRPMPLPVVPGEITLDASLTEDRVKELVSEAAGIPNDDWTKLASATEVPSPDTLKSQTLSLMLFSLRALPPAGIESELPALANLKKDFQYLPEHTPKPAEIARALWISRAKGYASYIQPEYVTEVTVKVTGDTASGEVVFEKEGLYRGRVRYVARRVNGDWRIEEFHLPNVGLSLQLTESGEWKRLM